jgi:hypothetical protein
MESISRAASGMVGVDFVVQVSEGIWIKDKELNG